MGKRLVEIATGKLDLPQHPAGELGEQLAHDPGLRRAADGFECGLGEKQVDEFSRSGLENREIRDVGIVAIAVQGVRILNRVLELVRMKLTSRWMVLRCTLSCFASCEQFG